MAGGIGRLVLLTLVLLVCPSMNQAQQPVPVERVVFVCEHGSVKSLIAASYFNRGAKERGIPFAAVARGIAPDPTVPGVVQAGMNADGLGVSGFVPRLFRSADLDGVSLVVSFDQDITSEVGTRVPVLHWDKLPGVLVDYRRGRDAIVARVNELLDSLAKEDVHRARGSQPRLPGHAGPPNR
jgi:arsenate reductase